MGSAPSNPPPKPAAPVAQQAAPSQAPMGAIAKINQTIENVEKRKGFIEKQMAKEMQLAKQKMEKGDKKGALFHVKKKKMLEKEIEKLDGAFLSLNAQKMSLESATTNIDIVDAMTHGKTAMQQMNAKMNVESVQDLKDDIEEQHQEMEEINQLMGQPIGMPGVDEDELESELAALQEDELMEEVPKAKTKAAKAKPAKASEEVTSLPAAPTGSVKKAEAEQSDEDALRELEAQLAA